MTSREQQPSSYLRAVREVVPNDDVVRFLAKAKVASMRCFGVLNLQVEAAKTLDEELADRGYTAVEQLRESKVTPFDEKRLRATLFECRALSTDELNDNILAAYARVTSNRVRSGNPKRTPTGLPVDNTRPNPLPERLRKAQIEAGLPAGRLIAPARTVVATALEESTGVYFYALKIDDNSKTAEALTNQTNALEKEARITQALKRLVRTEVAFDSPKNPLEVPFMIAPDAPLEAHERFLNIMNLRGVVDLELSSRVIWQEDRDTTESED